MEFNSVTILVTCGVMVMVFLDLQEIQGSPLEYHSQKPENCPHGQCFLDGCVRMCACDSKQGNVTCERMTGENHSIDMHYCENNETDTICPLGESYRSEVWPQNYICYCNHDKSRTYECIDTDTQKPPNPTELLNLIRVHAKAQAPIVKSEKN